MNDRIIEGDALEEMRELPDSCIDLIATDPPYYKVKGEPWDRQWETPELFLRWMGELRDEWYRLLKLNGSLYVFVSPKMAARVECLVAEKFNILNQIRWIKDAGWHRKANQEAQRLFLRPWEGIIFAEHHFEPLRAYLAGERDRAGWTTRKVAERYQMKTGSRTVTGMARHWFRSVQWAFPTAENYQWLRELFNRDGGEFLRREYEDLQRPFDVGGDVPRTDTWNFKAVQPRKGRHPCEKPLALMEHIIRVSSRPGAVVLDCFAGSGSTCVAARNLERRYIGIENNAKYVEQINERLSKEQQYLFA